VNQNETRRLLRTLLLPINLESENVCIAELGEHLADNAGDDYSDCSAWLNGQISEWNETGSPSPYFKLLIEHLLRVGNPVYGEVISQYYFRAHEELISNQLVNSELARSFLSHLLLIVRLSLEEKMSCAQISKILGVMNPSAGFGRRSIAAILTKMGVAHNLSTDQVTELYRSDQSLSDDLFNDATLLECTNQISELGFSLGLKEDIGRHLQVLLNEQNVAKFNQYVQILHYQCTILEYYDHDVKDFYEFTPRGIAAKWLFDQYPSAMVEAGNPFLNNAKSVGQVNFPWAAAKKNKEFPGASALYAILSGLDEMGYAARQEIALWLRVILHRFMALAAPLESPLPEIFSAEQYRSIVSNVARGNTATRGIIEQRIVDAITSIHHIEVNGWISRGIGDSVNASNLSKKKLGDCDFQNTEQRAVVAYEAHGGDLSQAYLNEHLRNLPKLTKSRFEEWKTFSIVEDWTIEIFFIAHSFSATLPEDRVIEGCTIKVRFLTYNGLYHVINHAYREDILHRLVLTPLSKKRTPAFVRRKLITLLD
jgi:hypothetical protein